MLKYQADQAGINNSFLRYALQQQQGGPQPTMGGGQIGQGGGDFTTPEQARAATANLGQPGTTPAAPMLGSANGTPGTSYAAPQQTPAQGGSQASAQSQYDPFSSYIRSPMGAMQFVFDKPGFFNRVAPQPTDFIKQLVAAGIDPNSQ